MTFRVNEDKPTRKATIHRVNDNRDCQPQEKRPENGRWIEGLPTIEEAIQAATATGQEVQRCQVCNPS